MGGEVLRAEPLYSFVMPDLRPQRNFTPAQRPLLDCRDDVDREGDAAWLLHINRTAEPKRG